MKAVLTAVAVLAVLPAAAAAQQLGTGPVRVAATIGRMDYDMSVVGQANVFSGRLGVRLGSVLGLEAYGGYAAVEEEDLGTTRLYMPEAQIQARWPLGRISPFVGAGAGLIVAESYDPAIGTDSEVTFSAAGGLTADVGSRMLLLGDVRLRGVGPRMAGATGDLNVGVGFRF